MTQEALAKSEIRNPKSEIPRRSGAVIVITLLALLLLAGMVFYVLNLGRQVNGRVTAQHAADSAAAGGAGWIARSLNTVAMDNVAICQELAAVNALSALPLATAAATPEQTFFRDRLQDQLGAGIHTSSAPLNDLATQHFQMMLDELNKEIDRLKPVDDLVNHSSFDVRTVTFYKGPQGRGELWKAMESLDQFSQATMENVGALAQLNAIRGGEKDLPVGAAGNEVGGALLVPVVPAVPWKRGRFDDFRRPVDLGRLPTEVDDELVNRGPFDAVFGWRDYIGHWVRDGGGGGGGGGGGNQINSIGSPFGGGPNIQGPNVPPANGHWVWDGYNPYGTQGWTQRRVGDANTAWLRESRWGRWMNQLARAHLDYCWFGTALRRFAMPKWDAQYPANLPPNNQPLKFSETGFFRLDLKSKFEITDGMFMTGGTYALTTRRAEPYKSVLWRRAGWWLPVRQGTNNYVQLPDELPTVNPAYRVQNIGPNAWLVGWEYKVGWDPEIGIMPALDPATGQLVLQPAYFYQVVLFAGVDNDAILPGVVDPADPKRVPPNQYTAAALADQTLTPEVADPYAGFQHDAPDAPAPIDLDHKQVTRAADARRQYLTYMGIARRNDGALVWPSKFDGRKPYPYMVSLAEIQVFNNHSWDLWTQMWSAQVETIRDYGGWVSTLKTSSANADQVPTLVPSELDGLYTYLHSAQPLADWMLRH